MCILKLHHHRVMLLLQVTCIKDSMLARHKIHATTPQAHHDSMLPGCKFACNYFARKFIALRQIAMKWQRAAWCMVHVYKLARYFIS